MLADGLRKFRADLVKALAAYNGGKGAVRSGKISEATLTRYVPRVLGYLEALTGNAPQRRLLKKRFKLHPQGVFLALTGRPPPAGAGRGVKAEKAKHSVRHLSICWSPASLLGLPW